MHPKICTSCGTEKHIGEFYKRKESPDGYRRDCKSCCKTRSLKNHYANKESKNRKAREDYHDKVAKNPNFNAELYAKKRDYSLAKSAEFYRKSPERYKERVRNWVEANRGKSNAIKKAYKAAKLMACPPWVRNNKSLRAQMDEIYERALLMSAETGVKYHVDHIVPLRGKNVSGLHVPWNLQILTGSENCSKSNKLIHTE